MDLEYNLWAEESFQIIENFVYQNISQEVLPTDEYVEKATAIAERQIAKAGYRLAHLLTELLNPTAETNEQLDYTDIQQTPSTFLQ